MDWLDILESSFYKKKLDWRLACWPDIVVLAVKIKMLFLKYDQIVKLYL